MISLNPFDWFANNDNHYQACFKEVNGLGIVSDSIYSGNLFGYNPVHANGIEIGHYNLKSIDKDLSVNMEIVIDNKYNIPVDSTLEIVKNYNNCFKRNDSGYINVILGSSDEFMKDKNCFLGNECEVINKK